MWEAATLNIIGLSVLALCGMVAWAIA